MWDAAKTGRADDVRRLLEEGADIETTGMVRKCGSQESFKK